MTTYSEQSLFSKRLISLLDIRNYHGNRGRQTALSKTVKLSQSSIRKWLKGEAIPRLQHMQFLAQHFKCRIEWLHYGNGAVSDSHEADGLTFQRHRQLADWSLEGLSHALQTSEVTPKVILEQIEALELGQLVDYKAFLKRCNAVLDEKKEETMPSIPQKTVIKPVAEVKGLIEWQVDTQAMAPTLGKGVQVLLDTQCQTYSGEGIYRVSVDGEPLVRRLQAAGDDKLHLLPDNPVYQARLVRTAVVQVLGKVMWISV